MTIHPRLYARCLAVMALRIEQGLMTEEDAMQVAAGVVLEGGAGPVSAEFAAFLLGQWRARATAAIELAAGAVGRAIKPLIDGGASSEEILAAARATNEARRAPLTEAMLHGVVAERLAWAMKRERRRAG